MELRTLRYFVAVAEAGSVTAATSALHISQPSLSRQLHQLERELGLDLFVRRDGRLTLTPAGQQFLPSARDVLTRADAARAAAAALRSGALPEVTIAAPEVTINDVVAPFFATFGEADPLPRVFVADLADEYASLDRGADLVIGTRPPGAGFASRPLATLPVFAYVPGDHRLASRGSVRLVDLVGYDLLVLSPLTHARRALDAALDADQVPVTLTEMTSSQVAQAVAAAGRGVAVVSDDPRFGLVGLPVVAQSGPVRVHLHAAWQPDHHAAVPLAHLAERLGTFVAARYGR